MGEEVAAAERAAQLLRRLVAERPGGEVRAPQERMVRAVATAVATGRPLLVQAGTGTGKTLGYLVPAIASGRRVVVSTATKQLGEQVLEEDVPALVRLLAEDGRSLRHALLKGRRNYLCLDRVAELSARAPAPAADPQGALFDLAPSAAPPGGAPGSDAAARGRPRAAEVAELLAWARTTPTGDRSHGPAVSDAAWEAVSTDGAGCPGASACPFSRECFAERARAAARAADVVVTNHAQVARDLASATPVLGGFDVVVLDEAHEAEQHLSAAWAHHVAPAALHDVVVRAARRLPRGRTGEAGRARAEEVLADLAALSTALQRVPPGPVPRLPDGVHELLEAVAGGLISLAALLEAAAAAPGASRYQAVDRRGAAGQLTEALQAVTGVAVAAEGQRVRWLEAAAAGPVLRAAPLHVGPWLADLLGERTLVATSATATVGGSFGPLARALGLVDGGHEAVDVGSPFDHARQAVLYVPGPGFPVPVGAGRDAHAAAVREELTALVRAAGGRTLALFTTRRAAEDAAAHLRATATTPVLLQGEAPASALLEEFAGVEAATLCATLGFWHGVDVPGPSLSCVVMDKIPFAPADDPLVAARRAAADAEGRDGFVDVFVAGAATVLAQGAGRLVRTSTDRGVVAVLDPRLRERAYGGLLRASLPPMRVVTDRAVVEAALVRLTGGAPAHGDEPARAAATAVTGTAPAAGAGVRREPGAVRRAAPRRAATRALARSTRAAPA